MTTSAGRPVTPGRETAAATETQSCSCGALSEREIRAGLESLRLTRGWDQDLLKAVVTTLIVADLPEGERRAFFAELLDQALAKLGEQDRVAAIEIADSQGGLSALRFIMNRRANGRSG